MIEKFNPLLSICLPTYNRADLLQLALHSLVPQIEECKGEVELIISDNASSDNTYEVVKEALECKYIHYYCNNENIGAVKNMVLLTNELANGEYCWIIGDDDMVNRKKLSKILNILRNNRNLDYFYVNYYCKSIEERNDLILKSGSSYLPSSRECMFSDYSEGKLSRLENLLEFQSENLSGLFTAVVCHILRRSKWIEYSKVLQFGDGLMFSSLDTTYPHLKVVVSAMYGKPVYYIGDPCILLGQGSQEWSDYLPMLFISRLNDVLDLYIKLGINEKVINHYKTYFLKDCGSNLLKIMTQSNIAGREYISLEKFFQRFGSDKILWDSLANAFKKNVDLNYPILVLNSQIGRYIQENKKIALWGSGETGENLINILGNLKGNISVVVDGNEKKQGLKFSKTNLIIQNPEYLLSHKVDVIVIASLAYADDIINDIKNKYNIQATIISTKGIQGIKV
jgi:glycosyltransferase involved in cell wall biosynthesis